jgi:glycosyltransferase involved in cell wall biosynthesis
MIEALSAAKPVATKKPLEVMVVSQYRHVGVGGAERYISEVCSRLEQDHGFHLQHLASDLEPPLLSSPRRLFTTGFNTAWYEEVMNVLTTSRPDVLYVHHTVPGLTDVVLRAAQKLHIPVALMYHGDVTGPELFKQLLGRLYHSFVGQRSLQVPQTLFVNSLPYIQASPYLRHLQAGHLPIKFVEAPPGVDAVISKGQRNGAGVAHEQKNRYLLFVGKPHVKSKGLGVLEAAWRRLRVKYPDVDLMVIGDTTQHEDTSRHRESQRSEEGLHYLGKVASRQDLADWYASAQATVLPSTSTAESFGMVLAEALLAGCPIVGSDVGGIPALVEHGKNGYLVPRGDVAALTRALELTLEHQEDLRQAILQQRQVQKERFSWDRTSSIVASHLSQVAWAK